MATEQLRFDGEVAIITGAGGKGMGASHASLLASRGCKVVIFDLFPGPAQEVVDRITAAGGTAVAVIGSVSDRSDCEKAVQTAVQTFGKVTILMNNAGIDIVGPFEALSDEVFEKTIDVNLKGTWYMTKTVWPLMKAQKYGRILMVSSNSIYGMPENSAYVASKGAVFALARSLALEGKAFGIQVNSLGPVAFTPMMVANIAMSEETTAQIAKTLPAEAVSPVVAWLLHRECQLSGEFILSFGSRVARMFMAETDSVGEVGLETHTVESVRESIGGVFQEESGRFHVPRLPNDTLERYFGTIPGF